MPLERMDLMPNPKVTVLMPVYNGEKYLLEAIDSILNQTFTDFEFLIINDGSTDGSREIIESFSDHRIVLVNQENIGLTNSLNKGIDMAIGEYIARMDCDDISLPLRLEKQVGFMDAHPEIGVCGSWILVFSGKSRHVQRYPTTSDEIKCFMFYNTGVAHPSVMIRREVFLKNGLYYDSSFAHAQDYELWIRAFHYTNFANIPKVLLHYRISPTSVSIVFAESQMESASRVRERQLNLLGIYPNEHEKYIHDSIMRGGTEQSKTYISDVNDWLLKIRAANRAKNIYSEPSFSNSLSMLWFNACFNVASLGNCTWKIMTESPLYDNKKIGLSLRVKLLLKCMIPRIIINKLVVYRWKIG